MTQNKQHSSVQTQIFAMLSHLYIHSRTAKLKRENFHTNFYALEFISITTGAVRRACQQVFSAQIRLQDFTDFQKLEDKLRAFKSS